MYADGKRAKHAKYMREYLSSTPERQEKNRDRARQWGRENPERAVLKATEWAKANPEKRKAHQIGINKRGRLKKYGLTEDQFNQILFSQESKCKICSKLLPEGNRRPCVDHCHTSGRVRGILCSNCNIGLGNFRDNMDFLSSAIKYLKDTSN